MRQIEGLNAGQHLDSIMNPPTISGGFKQRKTGINNLIRKTKAVAPILVTLISG